MSPQRPGTSGRVRKVSRSLPVRSAVTGRFQAVRDKTCLLEPAPETSAIPNGGLASALERLKALPPNAYTWVHEMTPLPGDVPEIIGPLSKGDRERGEQ